MDAILNGLYTHPGATLYTDTTSIHRLSSEKNLRSPTSRRLQPSRGVIMHHGKIHEHEFEGKVVYRHLKDGDVVLVNRQVMHYPI